MAKSEQIRQGEKNTILKMLMDCHNDNEIINELRIPRRTFYRYKKQIYKEWSESFLQQRASDVGFHTERLRNRLTRYLKVVEKNLKAVMTRMLLP
jgi:ACT domain-containing protein